jgi:hypothetical protein
MRATRTLTFAFAISVWTAAPALADVLLTMKDGRVSIVAKDATIRQILTEWARVGKTKIVNLERIPGGPLTLELTNVTEVQALAVLLRSLSGYIVAPRAADAANLSQFDRIIIIPTLASERPALAAAAPPPAAGAPSVAFKQAPTFVPPTVDDRQETDAAPPEPTVTAAMVNEAAVPSPNPAATFNRTSGALEIARQGVVPGRGDKGNQPATAVQPRAPFAGVAVPGMMVPTAPQPGQPGQPVRRPGGQ